MEQIQNRPILFTSTIENIAISKEGRTESWMDIISVEKKCNLAFWFECTILCGAMCVVLAPNRFRHLFYFKAQWHEIDGNIPVVVYDWYVRRSALAILTHALYWLLYDTMNLDSPVVYALASLPFGIISAHDLLNATTKECDISKRADTHACIVVMTQLLLLYIKSPYLVVTERICNILTVVSGLHLLVAPSISSWVYRMPQYAPESSVISYHMNFFGCYLIVMSTLGSALVWQNNYVEQAREVTLLALGMSLLFSVIGYAFLIEGARLMISNLVMAHSCVIFVLLVGTILIIF